MPSGSTPTFVYKSQNIGMNLVASYRAPYSEPNTPMSNHNIADVRDPKRHGACCNIRYDDLLDNDVDQNEEANLQQQFPRFSNRIHHLIEERREYRERPNQERSSNCTIL